MTQAEHNWHLLRQSGLGGTDMARLAGSSPWGTAADVYVEKMREQLKQLMKNCDGIQLK